LAANQAPVPTYYPTNFTAYEGQPIARDLPIWTDPEGTTVTYSFGGLPSFLSFDPLFMQLKGTAPFATAKLNKYKNYTITMKARDAAGKSGSRKFVLRVMDANEPLRPVAIADLQATEDAPFSFTLPAVLFTDPEGQPFTSRVAQVPNWLSYDSGTRLLSGTPTQAEVGTNQFVVIDGTDSVGTRTTYQIRVVVTGVNDPPRISQGIADQMIAENQATTFTPYYYFVDDEDGDRLTMQYLSVPSFATINADAQPWPSLYLTPTTADIGVHTVTWRVTDPAGAALEGSFKVTVQDVNQAPVAGPWLEPFVVEAGQPWHLTLPEGYFTDPDGDPLTFVSHHRGTSPDPYWLAFDPATQSYFGQPRPRDAGTYHWSLEARDPEGLLAYTNITVQVVDPDGSSPPRCVFEYYRQFSYRVGEVGELRRPFCDDPEGGPLTYTFEGVPDWLVWHPEWSQYVGTPTVVDERGTPVTVVVTDAAGDSVRAVIVLRVYERFTTDNGVGAVVRAPSPARTDGDVNDPRARYQPNDAPDAAQLLPRVPAVIGGFAAATPTGATGDRFATAPDPFDGYEAELTAGMGIELIEAEPDQIDLDLYLFEAYSGELVDFSIGATGREALTVPATGRYRVVVAAEVGNGNYFLYLGLPSAPAAVSMTAAGEYVAGEAVVLPKRGTIGGTKPGRAFGATGAVVAAGEGTGPLRVDLRAMPVYSAKPLRDDWLARALRSSLATRVATARAIKQLRADPTVAAAAPNYRRKTAAFPTGGLYWRQWALDQIGVAGAWSKTNGDAATVVAVVDTGVFMAHPGLTQQLRPDGYDFVSDPVSARDGDGIDADPDDPGDAEAPGLRSYHGTHVAGIVAADGPDNVGTAGVAWDARILPVRVLGEGGGTSYDVMQGVRYAAGLANDSGTVPTQRADIINLSLAGDGYSEVEQATFDEVRALGVFVVAAAGNEGRAQIDYPAAYAGVIAVGATDLRRGLTEYSNHGDAIDLVAPGGDTRQDVDGDTLPDGIFSTFVRDDGVTRGPAYDLRSGTSMAAPHVAGAIALMLAVDPTLTPDEFDADLSAGLLTEDLGVDGAATWNERYGYGLINAGKAVARALERAGGGAGGPLYVAEPALVSLTVAQPAATLRFVNRGVPGPRVIGISPPSWAAVNPIAVDDKGFGDYEVVARPGQFGHLRESIQFIMDDSVRVFVPVRAEYPDYPPPADQDAGIVYLTLLDPVTYATVASVPMDVASGAYYGQMRDLPPGEYLLVAGTDRDNDQMICDPGEACAGWPSLGALQRVTVDLESYKVAHDMTLVLPQSTFGVAMPAAVQKVTPSGFPRSVVPTPVVPAPALPATPAPAAPERTRSPRSSGWERIHNSR
jgi:serine protease